jgi:hypothetical protein
MISQSMSNSILIRDDTKTVQKLLTILLDPEIVERSELEESLAQTDMFADLLKQAIDYEE